MRRKKGKFLFAVLFSVLLLVPYLSLESKSASAEEFTFPEYGPAKDLITPLNGSPTIYDGAVGQEDGHDVLYTTSKGVPATFNVVDLDENKLLRSIPLEGASDSWHHEVAPDGTVYVAAGKHIWGYSPETKTIEALAEIPDSSLWALAVDENSNAYIGTFKGGKVFQYNKETKQLRDYGKMIGDIEQEYVRSMDYHDGYIYAGTAHDKIFKLNVETGEKVEIAEELNESGFVYDLDIVDGRYVFARYSASKNMYIYDTLEEKWLDVKLTNVNGLHVTDSLDNKVYFIADGIVKYVDLTNLQVSETSMKYGSGFRGSDWVEIEGDSRLPGKSLVTVTFSGGTVFFNIETEKVVSYPSVIPPTANVTNQIHAFSEDKIYISGMTGGTGAVYNPLTGENKSISLGQADSIYSMDNKVYFGTYPSSSVHVIDPSVDPYAKPTTLFTIGNEQDRLHAMTGGDGKLFIGSIATYQRLGGALTVYDGETHKVFRNIVENQSINGLAYKDGLVYGSTTIKGGLGSVPTAEQAKLFTWDPITEQKINEKNLEIEGLDKPIHIGDLSAGPNDDYIWGGSTGYVFALNPDTLEVEKSVRVEEKPYPFEWDQIDLKWSEDGLLYALVGVKLYVINPDTLDFKFVTKAVSFDLGKDGNIYFSKYDNRTIMAKIEVMEADASDDLQSVQLEMEKTNLTRGQTSNLKVTGILKNSEKIDLTNYTVISSNEEALKVKNDQVIAYRSGESTVQAEVDWKGKKVLSNEVVVKVDLTLDSFEAYVEKLYNEKKVPKKLYIKLSVHMRLAKHFDAKGYEKLVQHQLEKMKKQVERWDAGDHQWAKDALLTDINGLNE
ncbi:FIMAH domain-containing protein [Metabacillus arenae]|uniref:FIMAH domain-containing protein n=1 Tax=Metabacillus arenae TaxID=2771434 RepID=A0A926RZT5_9BACI|nr:hypothetical protein [Metabacillus arenae]MBD1379369.1 hypothetical protein [Metabacillus arenae]